MNVSLPVVGVYANIWEWDYNYVSGLGNVD